MPSRNRIDSREFATAGAALSNIGRFWLGSTFASVPSHEQQAVRYPGAVLYIRPRRLCIHTPESRVVRLRRAPAGSPVDRCRWVRRRESQGAADGQSKADFISKNCIALKEVREAKFWLRQLRDADPQRLNAPATPLISEAEELRKIVTSIVVSAKRNRSFRGERSK